ncbi:hypothetical protein LEMLEM_LOCUS25931 [Lemmus lemmus]
MSLGCGVLAAAPVLMCSFACSLNSVISSISCRADRVCSAACLLFRPPCPDVLSILQQDDCDPAVLQCWRPHLAVLRQSVSAGVHRWLLLHPVLRRRPAGCRPLLPQLQSTPGHLQALVGLGQPAIGEMVDTLPEVT